MKNSLKDLSLIFAAGCIGGFVMSLAMWFLDSNGINTRWGLRVSPELTLAWFCPRIVWGGLWGFLFLLPIKKESVLWRGLILSLIPTVFHLFILEPIHLKRGFLGISFHDWTPLATAGLNALWGISTALWLKWVRD